MTDVAQEFQIGITDQYDASVNYEFTFKHMNKLLNIFITRNISDSRFRWLLNKHSKNIILHLVISGWGGTPVEPNTPNILQTCEYLKLLLELGFPKDHIVFRLDPIIPNQTGIDILPKILQVLSGFGIKRLRYKMLLHPDVMLHRQSWHQACFFMGNPYYSESYNKVFYSAADWQRKKIYEILESFQWAFELESCDKYDIKNSPHNLACISHKDLRVIGINNVDVKFNYTNKNKCQCPDNRTSIQSVSHTQCPLKCSHCRKTTLLT